jgi:hypothetical protein
MAAAGRALRQLTVRHVSQTTNRLNNRILIFGGLRAQEQPLAKVPMKVLWTFLNYAASPKHFRGLKCCRPLSLPWLQFIDETAEPRPAYPNEATQDE